MKTINIYLLDEREITDSNKMLNDLADILALHHGTEGDNVRSIMTVCDDDYLDSLDDETLLQEVQIGVHTMIFPGIEGEVEEVEDGDEAGQQDLSADST